MVNSLIDLASFNQAQSSAKAFVRDRKLMEQRINFETFRSGAGLGLAGLGLAGLGLGVNNG